MKEVFNGLEQARREFNNWSGRAAIFLDFEDMTAWTRVFEIPNYKQETIVTLVDKDDLYERNYRIGAERCNTLVEKKLELYKSGNWNKHELSDNFHMEFTKILATGSKE